MTKQIVFKEDLIKAFNYYLSELREFLYQPATPAMEERMRYKLESIRSHKMRYDTNSAWNVPILFLKTESGAQFTLEPDISDFELRERNRQRSF